MIVNLSSLQKYPALRQFVIDNEKNFKNPSNLEEIIAAEHDVRELIEYFLKHSKEIENSDGLSGKLLNYSTKNSEHYTPTDWYSLLAEIEAFHLLHNKLNLNVCGYELPEPKHGKKPDFSVKHNNEIVYFEVKDRCGEVVQGTPREINRLLDKIEADYGHKYMIRMSDIENLKDKDKRPNYQRLYKYLSHLTIMEYIEKEIRKKLDVLEHSNILLNQNRPGSSVLVRNIKIYPNRHERDKQKEYEININFHIRLKQNIHEKRSDSEDFLPDEIEDVRKWLFEEKPEEDKIPQVKQAEAKGADYLMCRIPFWNDTFYDYIRPLFSNIKLKNPNYAESKLDTKLSGLILFHPCGSLIGGYIVVDNTNTTPKIKEWLKKE